MSTLRDQILDRINETPYRPPCFADICRLSSNVIDPMTGYAHSDILDELKVMLEARLIDTETGTDGLTYRKAKPPYVPAERPHIATVCTDAGIAYFPSKNQQPKMPLSAVDKARIVKQRAAEPPKAIRKTDLVKQPKNKARHEVGICGQNRSLIARHLTEPMSAAEFSHRLGIKATEGGPILTRAESQRIISGENRGRPKLFFFLPKPSDAVIAEARKRADKFKRAQVISASRYDVTAIVAEYVRGDSVELIAKNHRCNKRKVKECVLLGGLTLRTKAQINTHRSIAQRGKVRVKKVKALKGIKLSDEQRQRRADQMRINQRNSSRNKRRDAFAGRAEA